MHLSLQRKICSKDLQYPLFYLIIVSFNFHKIESSKSLYKPFATIPDKFRIIVNLSFNGTKMDFATAKFSVPYRVISALYYYASPIT